MVTHLDSFLSWPTNYAQPECRLVLAVLEGVSALLKLKDTVFQKRYPNKAYFVQAELLPSNRRASPIRQDNGKLHT